MPEADFLLKQKDTSPAIEGTLQDNSGSAVDISNGSVNFHMGEHLSGSVIVDTSATIVTGSEGKVKYEWATADTKNAGEYKAEWEVTYADDKVETFPNGDDYITISIAKKIA